MLGKAIASGVFKNKKDKGREAYDYLENYNMEGK